MLRLCPVGRGRPLLPSFAPIASEIKASMEETEEREEEVVRDFLRPPEDARGVCAAAPGEGGEESNAARDVVPFLIDRLDIVSSSPPSAEFEELEALFDEREREPEPDCAADARRPLPVAGVVSKSEGTAAESDGRHSSPSRSAMSIKVGELSWSIGDGSPLQVKVGEMPPEPVEREGAGTIWFA